MAWIPDYLQITFDTLCALPPEEAAATMAAAGQAALEVLGMPPEECYCTLLFYAAHADGRWLCGHIGDGYIFRDPAGHCRSVLGTGERHAINETYFLSEPAPRSICASAAGSCTSPTPCC